MVRYAAFRVALGLRCQFHCILVPLVTWPVAAVPGVSFTFNGSLFSKEEET
jgi:hypothetical protein